MLAGGQPEAIGSSINKYEEHWMGAEVTVPILPKTFSIHYIKKLQPHKKWKHSLPNLVLQTRTQRR
jgi:hypothetical protein